MPFNKDPFQQRRLHFIGIGGIGMSGIAEILLNLGYTVTGSDLRESPIVSRLRELGATIWVGHGADQVGEAEAVVTSSAIPANNPELAEARRRKLPVIARGELLAELMRVKYGIAVAGSHGKTSTSSICAAILGAGGMDPTVVIGGRVASIGSSARLGRGDYLLVEADESDASFLHLRPMLAVVTNIDEDHMATYGHDFERLCATFIEFIHRLPFYGTMVLCIDDPVLRNLLPKVSRPMLTYGFAPDADYRAGGLAANGRCWRFRAHRPGGREPLDISLAVPGEHNVRNALAAIAVATHEGVADAAIGEGLAGFAGVGRRFQIFDGIEIGGAKVTLVDDYGHHPTEIEAVLRTARAVWPGRRFVMAYQPHRYSRTRDQFDQFVRVLAEVDQLILLDVYAAGEAPIPGADSHALCRGIRSRGATPPISAADPEEALGLLPRIVRSGDVVLVQGAGNVSGISNRLRGGKHVG